MPPDNVINADPSITKLVAAVMGSFISLKFMKGTWYERLMLFVGGAFLSYNATSPLAHWLNFQEGEGLIGFSVGLLGMALAEKLYEAVQATDAKQVSKDLWSAVKKRIGVDSDANGQ